MAAFSIYTDKENWPLAETCKYETWLRQLRTNKGIRQRNLIWKRHSSLLINHIGRRYFCKLAPGDCSGVSCRFLHIFNAFLTVGNAGQINIYQASTDSLQEKGEMKEGMCDFLGRKLKTHKFEEMEPVDRWHSIQNQFWWPLLCTRCEKARIHSFPIAQGRHDRLFWCSTHQDNERVENNDMKQQSSDYTQTYPSAPTRNQRSKL